MLTRGAQRLDQPIAPLLRPAAATVGVGETAEQVLGRLRQGQVADRIVYFYVLDGEQRLVGVVPTRRLLASAPAAAIRSLMVDKVVALPHQATLAEACDLFLRHRLLALPVVDPQGRLSGIVELTQLTGEMVDLAEQRGTDGAFELIGLHLDLEVRGRPWSSFKSRFPWLLCSMAGGMICAWILGRNEEDLARRIALTFFVPLVLALAESVSIQSMSVALSRLLGAPGRHGLLRRAWGKEALVALLLGSGAGLAAALLSWIWKGEPRLSLVIGGSIFLAAQSGCLLGFAFPTVLHRLRRNPRVASGPIILAATDVAALLIYFWLAKLLLAG